MSRLSTLQPKAPTGRIRSKTTESDTSTYEGGLGFSRKPKSELFLLVASSFFGEDTFYESSSDRTKRLIGLVDRITKSDPDWIRRFVPYLRNELNIRTAAIVIAVEYVIAGGEGGRAVIDSAISRADEPGETLGYARSRLGRSLPQPIKRGVADAARRLFNERSYLKYGQRAGYKMADVIRVSHPAPAHDAQSALFKYIVTPDDDSKVLPIELALLIANKSFYDVPVEQRRERLEGFREAGTDLSKAGVTWEALSGWLQGPMDAAAWEVAIPTMGYMALLRNLRNFEQAGISQESMDRVIAKLTDLDEVKRSRQLPIRFYSAYKALEGFKFLGAIEDALGYTLQNVPELKGRTLVLVDNSGSMSYGYSQKGNVRYSEVAGLFAAAVAKRADDADIVPFANDAFPAVKFTRTQPVLRIAERATAHSGGTNILGSLKASYDGHDRVIILTDEQSHYTSYDASDINVPIFTFNIAGYSKGVLPSGRNNRYTFGGLTDAGFRIIPLIEQGKDEKWPF